MTVLVICRGLPASGKTTYARKWVAESPCTRLRVNRDDLRAMLHTGVYVKHNPDSGTYTTRKKAAAHGTEQTVIKMRDSMIEEALRSGVSVISDDTNLPAHSVKELMRIATKTGAQYEVIDLTDVDPQECLRRNLRRKEAGERGVPDAVITDMYQRYIKGKNYPLPVPVVKELTNGERVQYAKPLDLTLETCVIFDIDGTLARMNGRSPYDYSQVHTDTPDHVLRNLYWLYKRAGYKIIFLSGRPDSCMTETEAWLMEHITDGVSEALLMRSAKDGRDDAQVKYELFDKHIRHSFHVHCVYDDRNRVVAMWRSIGLKCLQVADGDF